MDTGRTIGKDGEAVLIIVFITTGLEVYLDFAFFECSGCVSGDGCIEIQAKDKKTILKQLSLCGISEKYIYPGIDGAGKYIKGKYSYPG